CPHGRRPLRIVSKEFHAARTYPLASASACFGRVPRGQPKGPGSGLTENGYQSVMLRERAVVMHPVKLCRSALYLPAVNARAIEKSRTLPADCVILDLEDSVAPEMKEKAREAAALAARAGGYGKRTLVIRVNALSTPWGADDLQAAAASGANAALLPKVEGA